MRAGARSRQAVRVLAFVLLASGVIALVLIGVTIASTDDAFEAGQDAAASAWPSPQVEGDADGTDPVVGTPRVISTPPTGSTTIAALDFFDGASGERMVAERTLYVGDGVDEETLARGPGRYPGSAEPGAPGNLAISGHRTGWGSPLLHLDDLRPGDEVQVTDRSGRTFVYVVVGSQIVAPDAAWVLDPDPLGNGRPTLTLATCDPPHTDEMRLVLFAQLR